MVFIRVVSLLDVGLVFVGSLENSWLVVVIRLSCVWIEVHSSSTCCWVYPTYIRNTPGTNINGLATPSIYISLLTLGERKTQSRRENYDNRIVPSYNLNSKKGSLHADSSKF